MVICMVVFGSFAYAAGTFNKEAAVTGKVIANNPNLALFSDSACTIPLTAISFPDTNQGESSTVNVYLKNIGNKEFSGVIYTSALNPAVGTISLVNPLYAMGVNTTQQATLRLNVLANGTVGDINTSVTFNCSY